MRNVVLLVGCDAVDQTALVNRVMRRDPAHALGSDGVVPFALSTKYYSAHVRFWLTADVDGSTGSDASSSDESSTVLAPSSVSDIPTDHVRKDLSDLESLLQTVSEWSVAVGANVDALIVCIDSSEEAPALKQVDYLKAWSLFAEESEANVLLCVDVAEVVKTPEQEETLDACAVCCAEIGFEFIALSDAPLDTDAVGVERIIEALEANMWDGMVLKSDTKTQARDTLLDQSDLDQEESERVQQGGLVGVTTLELPSIQHSDPRMAAADFGETAEDYIDFKEMQQNPMAFDGADPATLPLQTKTIDELMASINLENDSFGEFMAASMMKTSTTESSDAAESAEMRKFLGDNLFDFDIPEFDDVNNDHPEDMRKLKESLFGNIDDDDYFERAIGQVKQLRENGAALGDEKRKDLAKKIVMALLSEDS
ncbi:hypothetical protein BJ741DRAFT_590231 [Chytriomyces cf. hyalinus JEL632]|nr:hypothetical protein BJ741DRAFT_590231 [Chytriomyces cf. hyalinus JEL632]